MDRPLPQVTLKEKREITIARLCEAFAQDRLEMAEFESRLDVANTAATAGELDALLADLPATPPPQPMPAVESAGLGVRDAIRDSRTFLAFMGGVDRRGNWGPARRNVVIAIMGGAALDFRDVQLPAGETEVYIFALMGGVEIIVPPDLSVDASGIAIMGGFEHTSTRHSRDPNAPILRVGGFCMMGGVEITVRHSGESARDARIREREERHRLRQEQKRLRGGE